MKKKAKNVRREVYPKPEHRFSNVKIGMTYHDSKPDFPPLDNAPPHAPNIVLVLLDDVGYGWPSACGGLVRMPAAENLAREGLTYCQFHTKGLCAPTRAALLTGRNHHSVSTGVVQEMATGFPGYSGILPRSCATIGKILSHNGYATGWWGKNHNTPDSQTSPAGPFTNWPTGLGFDYFYGFMGGETDQFWLCSETPCAWMRVRFQCRRELTSLPCEWMGAALRVHEIDDAHAHPLFCAPAHH